MNTWKLVYIYTVIVIICSFTPIIGRYIALINTLIHEVCHVIAAIFTGQKLRLRHKINLHYDSSGIAITQIDSWLGQIVVAYMGYTGASLATYGFFYLLSKHYYTAILYIFLTVAFLSTILWIRNIYGFVWILSFIVIVCWIIYKDNSFFIVNISIFLSCVMLVQSVLTAFIIFKTSIQQRKHAGDATALAKATKIPAVIWGTLFFSQSVCIVYFVFKL
ncbi:M50 family metallopeptidase [Niallia sp. 03133]|uniref:M50 family metallopeptidase n=1 Tax=Niallia sp. 03133 TaxID=3458060 RepID=UPI004044B151